MHKYASVSERKDWLLHQAKTQNIKIFRDFLPDFLRECEELAITLDLKNLDNKRVVTLENGASVRVLD